MPGTALSTPATSHVLALILTLVACAGARADTSRQPLGVDVWTPPFNGERRRETGTYEALEKVSRPWRICGEQLERELLVAEMPEDLVAQPALQRHRRELEQLSAWIDVFDFEQGLDTLDSLTRTIEAPS